MEFRLALIFLFLYYIRPQDWVQALIGFNVIKYMMVIWIGTLVASRERRTDTALLRTPHDWVMLSYFAYVVWNAPDPQATFSAFLPLVVFYALTVQSVLSWERILAYLKVWNFMLLGVAFLGVASLFGLDLTGAVDMTAQNAGRLAIGTWICNNPNSLAHTVVAAIPLSYMLYFWKGGVAGRVIIFPLCAALAGMCAYYTESRGSYLVAAGLMVMIFVIGRPPAVKALALAAAATLGVSALSFLPRMQQMGDLRSDEGVQGRLMAWDLARTAMEKTTTGDGWRQFVAMITWEGETLPKATHSSYVQIGADLGLYGLFLFVAALWCAAHSLISAHKITRGDTDAERCRRAAMIILIAYSVSSWMINREYHTEYFLIIALAAAIHRMCQQEVTEMQETADLAAAAREESGEADRPNVTLATRMQGGRVFPRLVMETQEEEETVPAFWKRLGLLDLIMASLLTYGVLEIWNYIIESL